MLTISVLARRFGLARSTLLHYDHLGLLRPAARSRNGYRRYGEGEVERLQWICTYRRAGLSLESIQRLLDRPDQGAAPVLEARLRELDREIGTLRDQQRVIAALLDRPELLPRTTPLDKATWVSLLKASGMSEADMDRWHRDFERMDPQRHDQFLTALGLSSDDVLALRRRYGMAPGAGDGS